MMHDGMGAMMWGMGLFGLFLIAVLAFAIAPPLKYLLSNRK